MSISEADIKLAVHKYCQRAFSEDLAADPPFVFSREHISVMQKMLGRADRSRSIRRVIKHAAICAAAVLVILVAACAVSPKVWAAVRSWYINIISPDKLVYEFNHEENDHAFLVVRPDNLPEGFELTELDEGDGYSKQTYSNAENGEYLKLSYHWATVGELRKIEKLEKKHGTVSIFMGQQAVLYTERGLSKLVWYDKYPQIIYWVESSMGQDALLNIFKDSIEMHPPIYEPTWLPNGYVVDDIYIDKGTVEISYINDNTSDFIVINCGDLGETESAFVLGDNVENVLNIDINGINAAIYCHNEGLFVGTDLVMIDETRNMVFTIETGSIDPDLVEKIARSLEKVGSIPRYMP